MSKKTLDQVISAVDSKFGKGTVRSMEEYVDIEKVSSGSIGLDIATGGGYPKGRIVEIFGAESSGKTTSALHAAVEVQKEGKMVLYLDYENAIDPYYCECIGLDMSAEKFRIINPDCTEDGFEIMRSFLEVDSIGLIVVDSVAAMTPKAELQGDFGDSKMGLQARSMSQGLRMLNQGISKSNCLVIFINQTRDKIGVMFGCFDYKTKVLLEDGSTECIGKIVNQKLPVKVMSLNRETRKYEAKKIKKYYNNGKADFFYKFTVKKNYGNGRSYFKCTPNHLIFTSSGEISADVIEVGDYVLSKDIYRLSDTQREIVYGSMLGDGSVKKNGVFCIGHGERQIDYCKWKQSYFSNITTSEYKNSKNGWNFETKRDSELNLLREELYKDGGRVLTKRFLEKLTPLSIAVWYMDDACLSGSHKKWGYGKVEISVKSYDNVYINLLKEALSKFGLSPKATNKSTLLFSGEESRKIQELVCEYICDNMQYKLSHHFRNKFNPPKHEFIESEWKPTPMKVLLKEISVKDSKYMNKFDIEIEDNHNYLVDGVSVHNSPETTTGGNALKFYASLRLKVSKSGGEKDRDGEFVSITSKILVDKNKVAPPKRKCEIPIKFGVGYDKVTELINLATELSIIDKKGSWFSYDDTKIGQGIDSARIMLEDNPELYEEIELKVKTDLGLIDNEK